MEGKKKIDWRETNIALIGSDQDKLARLDAAKKETNWSAVSKKFKVEPVPNSEYGNFFTGDSYIILKVSKAGNDGKLTYNAHFWIGSESTTDEYGTAAYKTVELDNFLKDAAIQHREVEGYESELFKSYFENITYLEGGYDTGFRHVTTNDFKPRLFVFNYEKKRHVVSEVPLSRKSIHSKDVFIYDKGTEAVQFNGSECNKDEKFEAAKYCRYLSSQRNGKLKISTIDQGDADTESFLKSLPDVEVSERLKKVIQMNKSIYRLADHENGVSFEKISDGSCPKDVLTEDDVYVICGSEHCYVYIGERSSDKERKNAFIYAQNLLIQLLNPFISITMVVKDKQTKEFLNTLE